MNLPGETEAGPAGMQPCRGIIWWAHRETMIGQRGNQFLALLLNHRIERPQCLENPRPEGAEPTLTENVASPFQAEPRHKTEAHLGAG